MRTRAPNLSRPGDAGEDMGYNCENDLSDDGDGTNGRLSLERAEQAMWALDSSAASIQRARSWVEDGDERW